MVPVEPALFDEDVDFARRLECYLKYLDYKNFP